MTGTSSDLRVLQAAIRRFCERGSVFIVTWRPCKGGVHALVKADVACTYGSKTCPESSEHQALSFSWCGSWFGIVWGVCFVAGLENRATRQIGHGLGPKMPLVTVSGHNRD